MRLDDSEPVGKPSGGSLWRDTLSAQNEQSTGFDGMLLFVGVIRVLSPFFSGYDLWFYGRVLAQPAIRKSLLLCGYPVIYRAWGEVALVGGLSAAVRLLFGLVLIWLFFRRRRSFRGAIITFLLLSVTLPWISLLLSAAAGSFDRNSLFFAAFWALWALFWIPYFLYSERVKNTFVR